MDAVLNQRSTSWRQLTAEQKTDLTQEKVMQLLLQMPTLLKRPIVDTGKNLLVGFSVADYLAQL